MTTTLERYAGAKSANYCTLPTVDVEILPDVHQCKACNAELVYRPHPKGFAYGTGTWEHVEGMVDAHRGEPKTRCSYCHSHEAVFRQHAWHDAVECPRCGGVTGYAIGD